MSAKPKIVTVKVERDSLESDLADMREVEQLLLDMMETILSERPKLIPALMIVHGMCGSLRAYLNDEVRS